MSKYTIHDLKGIIPAEQTPTTREAIEKYINEGVIPPYDPCLSCEPNHIRKLISVIQVAERNGLWPPKRKAPEVPKTDWAEGGYVAGTISREELVSIKEKRPEMDADKDVDTLDE